MVDVFMTMFDIYDMDGKQSMSSVHQCFVVHNIFEFIYLS